jgi:hypothetical protein
MMTYMQMWGVSMGDIELEHANMLESARMNELMGHAGVVLMNNKVFGEKCTSSRIRHAYSQVMTRG